MDDLIRKLSEIRSEYNCFDKDEESYYHALSEAIRILSRCADGDTISRQAAIDALGEKPLAWTEGDYELGLQNQWQSDIDALKSLPSADVQPVVHGHWFKRFYSQSFGKLLEMYVCSKCQQEYGYDAETGESEYNFCPDCGAKMDNRKGEDE